MNNILIIGGTSGIGKRVLKKYVKNKKNKIFVISKTKNNYDKLNDKLKLNENIKFDFFDINNEDFVINYIKKLAKIDKLFISSGSYNKKNYKELSMNDINKEFQDNVLSQMFFIKEIYKKMSNNSKILIISSICSKIECDNILYSLSKKTLNNFVKLISKKMNKKNISINTISPSIFKSNFHYSNNIIDNKKDYKRWLSDNKNNSINIDKIIKLIIKLLSKNNNKTGKNFNLK